MAVTMNDIAKLAGVSRPAVSAVLNGKTNCRVSPEKRRKVLELVKELNYIPNNAAKILKGGSSKVIALLCTFSPFGIHMAFVAELAEAVRKQGYNIQICDYTSQESSLSQQIEKIYARQPDGIIVHTADDINIPEIRIPHLVYAPSNNPGADIAIDSNAGVCEAVRHLLTVHGRKRVAFICTQEYQKEIIEDILPDKLAGWARAYSECGYDVDLSLACSLVRFNGEVEPLLQWLKDNDVDGVWASNDYVAGKLICVLQQNGVRVPEDISVIGYDGMLFTQFTTPELATIIQPITEAVQKGTELLFERINNKDVNSVPANLRLAPKFRCADSCGCSRKKSRRTFVLNTYPTLERSAKMNFNISFDELDTVTI
jgi:LacI family transcriptional regulator